MSSSKDYLIAKNNLLKKNHDAKIDAMRRAIRVLKGAECVCCTEGLYRNDIDLEGLILHITDVMESNIRTVEIFGVGDDEDDDE